MQHLNVKMLFRQMCVVLHKILANSNWIQDDPFMWFKNLNELFWQLSITEQSGLKCFYGEIQEAWHVLCFPVAVFFMWHFHFNLQILHICMQFSELNSNILPWRLYCSKSQVLCILLLIKRQILKYCCGRLVPDFLYKWNAQQKQQHAQHLEEFAISCKYPVFAFISLQFREGHNTCSTSVYLGWMAGGSYPTKLNTGCTLQCVSIQRPFIFVTSSVCFASLKWNQLLTQQ